MIKAYHFLQANLTAGSGDEKPWEIGESRTIAKPSKIMLGAYGYHSSPTLWDALSSAPGPVACLVEISQPIESDRTKSVSAKRKLIKAVNIDRELRLFACDCAERVLYIYGRGYPDNKCPHEAIEVSRRFADGKATLAELNAARYTARETSAAGTATAEAWKAVRAVQEAAASAATWAAAGTASPAEARSAETKWQREHFEQMFEKIFD